jgi:hypothetical protein
MRLTIKAYDPTGDYLELSNTAQELYDLGRITSPTGIAFDLNRFDTASDIYTFELRAPWKGIPFHKKLEIFANNEDVSSKTISNTNINLVKML